MRLQTWQHCARAPTYHFNHLQNPKVRPEVLHVAPHAPQNVPRVDGLGGGLIRTAGPGDHGSVGGLAVKALWLLGGPHDGFGRETLDSWATNVTTYKPTLTNRLVPPHGAGYVS